MPGIAGRIQNQGFAPALPELQRMMLPMQRHEWFVTSFKEARGAALGAVRLDSLPRIVRRGALTLAWAGEIVQQEDARARLREKVPVDASFDEVLLRSFEEQGPRSLCGLNGIYAIAVWDDSARRLHLINDRYGLQKIYLCQEGDGLAFSSELKSFIGPNRRISPLAAAQLLALGYMLDDETLFADVKLLPPASLLTYEAGRVVVEQYWQHNFDTKVAPAVPQAYVEGLVQRAAVAVARRTQPHSAILLTGGLDSRLISGMWARSGEAVNALSLGQPQAYDVNAARQVAQALGFRFHHIPLTPAYLSDLAEQCVWVTDGNMNVYASWILAANPALRSLGASYALSGVGGEAVAGRHILLESLSHTWEEGVEGFLHDLNIERAASFLRPELRGSLTAQIRSSIYSTVRDAPATHPLDKLDYYSYAQPLRRHATSVDVFADYAHPLDPLLDNNLIDYVQALPPELRARGYLYKRMIRQALPEIAGIGSLLRGPILKPALEKSLNRVQRFSQRAQRRLKRLTTRTPPPADNPQGYIFPNAWLRGGSKQFALAVMAQAERLEHVLDVAAARRIVDEHMSGQRNEYPLVCGLMTLILWQKMFVDGDQSPLGNWEGQGVPTGDGTVCAG